MSSALDGADHFLEQAGFDRGPWLALALAAGIAVWFALPGPLAWVIALSVALVAALGAIAAWRGNHARARLQQAVTVLALVFAAGLALVWLRSEMVGTHAIERPLSGTFEARILQRIEQPAEWRLRLVLAMREPETERAIKVRVNVPLEHVVPGLTEGAVVRIQARLMPSAPPMLPGAYKFARSAWFEGLAATGRLLCWRARSAGLPTTCAASCRVMPERSRRLSPAVIVVRSARRMRTPCAIPGSPTFFRSAGCT